MNVACLQLAFEDAQQPSARITRAVAELRAIEDADLVVFPELWPVGYFAFDRYADAAEPMDGPIVSAMCEVTREMGIYVHAGSFVERADDGRLFNTSVVIAPDGEIAHTYRKVHLFGHESQEARLLTPGTDAAVCATKLGVIAATTCYDLRFPELYRLLGDKGAEIVLVTSAWPVPRLGHWRLLTRARAVENQCYLMACNAAGVDNGVELGGNSVVVDPWGEVVAEAGAGPEVLRAAIDVPKVAKVREEFAFLADKRLRVEFDD